MTRTKRILAVGDWHCGHVAGLTPPNWWQPESDAFGPLQRKLWNWFTRQLKDVGKIDVLFLGGDLVDGPGRKSGGCEQIKTNPLEQAYMACDVYDALPRAKEGFAVYGTAYHTGDNADFEEVVAKHAGISIDGTQLVRVNGTLFNLRHHTGRSSNPYGIVETAKEVMWDDVKAVRGEAIPADVYLRWHTHWYRQYSDGTFCTMNMPALQWPGSKYGRRCSGDYTMGFVVFDVAPDGSYTWVLNRLILLVDESAVANV